MAGIEASTVGAFVPPTTATHVNGQPRGSASPTSPTDSKHIKLMTDAEKPRLERSEPLKQQENIPTAKQSKPKQNTRLFTGLFRRRDQNVSGSSAGPEQFRIIDITQSKWVPRSAGKDRETVTLDVKVDVKPDHVAAETRRSFRWIHHQRGSQPVAFTEFQQHVETVRGLYEEEVAVATRCLERVRRERKISARGRYFEKTVHRAETDHRVGEQQTPVRATFISMPIFALLQDCKGSTQTAVYPSSKEIRDSDVHPVRSLLQYSNILAIDNERDQSQVITKFDSTPGKARPPIQVPELWALVINMYTLITCCPLSVEELCGENIVLNSPSPSLHHLAKTSRDTRTIVKYTDQRGRLVDLECRQWQTLIDYIASVEADDDGAKRIELAAMLNDPDSDYKIVDLRFQIVDRSRWIDIVDSQYENAEFVHLRLARLGVGDILSLKFAQQHHVTFQRRTLVLTASRLYLEVLRNKLIKADRARAPKSELAKLKERIQVLRKQISRIHRSRLLSRFMLYAARYHLMMPPNRRNSIDADATFTGKAPGAGRRKHRRSSGQRNPFSNLWYHSPDRSRASSPSESPSTSDPRSSIPSDLSRTMPAIPQIVVQDEAESPASVRAPFTVADRVGGIALNEISSVTGVQRMQRPGLAIDVSSANADFDVESQGPGSRLQADRLRRSSTSGIAQMRPPETIMSSTTENLTFDARTEPPLRIVRRHSTSSGSESSVAILRASPLRRPLHAEGDAALRVPPRQPNQRSRPTPRRQGTTSSVDAVPEQNNPVDADETDFDQDIGSQAKERISGALARLTPFFEWQTGMVEPLEAGSPSILDFVDGLLSQGGNNTGLGIDTSAFGYAAIEPRSFRDICRRLETERDALKEARQKSFPQAALEADSLFHDSKRDLFLSTYGVLRCFMDLDRGNAKVTARVWGTLFEICDLSAKETTPSTYPHRHEVEFISAAAEQMLLLEIVTSDLLKNVRPDLGPDDTAVTYKVCTPLVYAFANIVAYLLSVWRATVRYGVEAEHINGVLDKAYDLLSESEVAFVRMKAHAEVHHDRFAGTESLKTADTLLALLIETALEISDGESNDGTVSPRFDLRYVYSRYTSECIVRAKRHASARIYKDVKLLIEEIQTVSSILTQQHHVFKTLLAKRESSLQALDKRIRRRLFAHLDETARHFEKLLEHARQAAEWNQHFIDVRGEDNNKAIYVFTAVTVIFLPLSFIAGLLGMNTKEIRDTTDTQWIFWSVALPFTITVLIVCIAIVRFKFLLRRRLNAVFGRCFGRR